MGWWGENYGFLFCFCFYENSPLAKKQKFWHLQFDYGSKAANSGKNAENFGN
jgi:hypothetical protein